MEYERINFQNSPSTATPLNAQNLNKMDKGIADAALELASILKQTVSVGSGYPVETFANQMFYKII